MYRGGYAGHAGYVGADVGVDSGWGRTGPHP